MPRLITVAALLALAAGLIALVFADFESRGAASVDLADLRTSVVASPRPSSATELSRAPARAHDDAPSPRTTQSGVHAGRAPATPASDAMHEHADRPWTVRVRVQRADGAAQQRGTLAVTFGGRDLGAESVRARRELRRAIEGDVTILELPAETARVRIEASASDGRMHGVTELDLWKRPERVASRKLDALLEIAPFAPGAVAHGALHFEGRGDVPLGSVVEAVPQGGDPDAADPDRRRRRGFVDADDGSYTVGPLAAGMWQVRVTAPSYATEWRMLPRIEAGTERVRADVEVGRGVELVARLVRGDGTALAEGTPVVCFGVTRTWATNEREDGESWRFDAAVGPGGVARFPGLPSRGRADVQLAVSDPRPRPAADQVDLSGTRGGRIEARLVVGDDELATVSGTLPGWLAAATRATAGVRVRRADRVGPSQRALLDAESGEWSHRLPPAAYEAWIEDGSRARQSEVAAFALAPAEALRDLEFAPVRAAHAEFVWDDAPSGWTLKARAHDGLAGGAATDVITTRVASGSCALAVPLGAVARFQLEKGPSCVVTAESEPVEAPTRREVAWGGNSLRRPTLLVGGEAPRGTARWLFARLDASEIGWSRYAVAVDARDGRAVGALPLPPGRYFHRYDAPEHAGLIGGVVEIGAGSELVVRWDGERVLCTQIAADPALAVFDLVGCGERALEDDVPLALRRFRLGPSYYTALAAGDGDPAVWWNSRSYAVRLVQE